MVTGAEELEGMEIPEGTAAEDTTLLDDTTGTPQKAEAASKAEFEELRGLVAEIAAGTKSNKETMQSLVDAIYNAPYSEGTSAAAAQAQEPAAEPKAEGRPDYNALAGDATAFADALLGEMKTMTEAEAKKFAGEFVRVADQKRDEYVESVRSKDPEMFDELRDCGMITRVSYEIERESPGKLNSMSPEKALAFVVDEAKKRLPDNARKLVSLLKKRHQEEVESASERPGPGGPRARLQREFKTNRETVEAALEETMPMFESAEKAAKEEGAIL